MTEAKPQKCASCGGALSPTTTTLTLRRNGVAVNFDDVPCLRCQSCGEEEFDGPLSVELGRVAEAFFQTGTIVDSLPEPIRHVHVDVSARALAAVSQSA